jgi:hypothetical protein
MMEFSVAKEESASKGYVPFNYNSRKIGNENLVVAEHGQWAVLSDEDMDLLDNGIIEAGSRD